MIKNAMIINAVLNDDYNRPKGELRTFIISVPLSAGQYIPTTCKNIAKNWCENNHYTLVNYSYIGDVKILNNL